MDGVMQAQGGERFKYEGWTFDFDHGEDGNEFKLDEILARGRAPARPGDLRELRGAWPSQ